MKKKPDKKSAAGVHLGIDIAKDKFDAVLRTTAGVQHHEVFTNAAAAVLHLRALSRARSGMVAARAALRVQAQETRERLIQQSHRTLLLAHDRQIRQMERALQAHLKAHPELAAEIALLTSIPGIAMISATAIRSELATLHGAGVRQTVAYAGLNPRQWQSGKSVQGRSRLSKTGNARLRHTLYLPALTGWRHQPLLRAFAARLLAKGKKKMEIVGALMHKLLAHCCGVLRTRQPFDPHWLAPQQTSA